MERKKTKVIIDHPSGLVKEVTVQTPNTLYYCTVCKQDLETWMNYCPNCGAKNE